MQFAHYFAAKLRHYMQCHFGKNDFNFGKCDFFRVFENSRGFRVESRLSISPDAFGGGKSLAVNVLSRIHVRLWLLCQLFFLII